MSEQAAVKIRGVKTKLFGVILMFLGGLDAMLSWRGNFEVSQFYWILLATGAFLIFLGSVRQNKAKVKARAHNQSGDLTHEH